MNPVHSDGGFTIVELLITTALLSLITAAVLSVAQPIQTFVVVQPEAADVQQRLRFAAATIRRAAEGAGALHHGFAAVLPYRIGERSADPSRGMFFRADAVTFVCSTRRCHSSADRRARPVVRSCTRQG